MSGKSGKSSTPLRGAIVAMAGDRVIGVRGELPWHYPEDLKHFKKLTTGCVIIMGRITWESIGCKALPKRDNIVISRSKVPEVEHYDSIEKAINAYPKRKIWVIGGGQIYRAAMQYLNAIYITHVPKIIKDESPVKFPKIDSHQWKGGKIKYKIEGKNKLHYVVFRRIPKYKSKLSKSQIIVGLQCKKRLWLEVHKPKAAVVSSDIQHRFEVGHMVHDVAQSLHENGHLIEWKNDATHAIAETRRILADSPDTPVFEATFSHKDVLVRTDILQKESDGYALIEVKSSTSVKESNYSDCAVQTWVLENNGVPLSSVQLAHINNQFIYRGDGDYHGLFRYEDIQDDIAEFKTKVPQWVARFKKILAGNQPNIEMGTHCHKPYPCQFINYCSPSCANTVKYPVTDLPNDRNGKVAQQLIAEDVKDIRDIPLAHLEKEVHEWVRAVTVAGEADLKSTAAIEINRHPYPRYYLDFETIQFAIPIWKGTRPYQTLPFQWSCHIEEESGKLSHEEFLDTIGRPPMRPLIESLLDTLGKRGAIFVYSSYEKTCLKQLAAIFPDLESSIQKIIGRLVDLLPITKQNYYHPKMHGSWSIKAVLPTIAPNLDYADLGEVQDGMAAGVAYQEIIHANTTQERALSLAVDLRNYCKRDTEALIALVAFLSSGKIQ